MDYAKQRELMVSQQIETRGIKTEAVLRAMHTVPRHLFIADTLLSDAYGDFPLPIGYQQTISQPYIVALMTEQLQLQPHHKVLEVGTGCGYQTAVLAEIADKIYTIEIVPELAARAQDNFKRLNYHNIVSKQGDGLSDWQDEAPFDRIIVTAAPATLPVTLVKQLKMGGSMVIPIGTLQQNLYRITRKSEN
ncbi:MAG: protein-L-isoaspartate(D-aspartate) O-methyltransferase, partial [Psychromonas sp.]|uniref:protein-L-isoaspartate(D-aspartate) O-methyltransferase n=1 Tax=Psychromonas sp. TaxID=1884585 RepID=UPI0039E47038